MVQVMPEIKGQVGKPVSPDYRTQESRFYEATLGNHIQRSIYVDLDAWDSGDMKVSIRVIDHTNDFEWRGDLGKLIEALKAQAAGD